MSEKKILLLLFKQHSFHQNSGECLGLKCPRPLHMADFVLCVADFIIFDYSFAAATSNDALYKIMMMMVVL